MNKVILMGRLARDPDVRTTQSGKSVSRMTLAVDRRMTKSDGQQTADFISLIAWEKLADFSAKYLYKGIKILVEGRLQSRSYEKDGQKHYVTEVNVYDIEFCEPKRANTADSTAADPADGFGRQVEEDDIPF